MKHILIVLLATVTLTGIVSCKKDTATAPADSVITFGDTTGMVVREHNKVIGFFNPFYLRLPDSVSYPDLVIEINPIPGELELMNRDQETSVTISSPTGSRLAVLAITKDVTQYTRQLLPDSVYAHDDSTFQTSVINWKRFITSSTQQSGTDIKNVLPGQVILQARSAGTPMKMSDPFFPLGYYYPIWQDANGYFDLYPHGDTLDHITHYNTYDYSNILLPGAETYIGFTFKDPTRPRLGWIKLKLLQDERSLWIMESALQR